MRIWLVQNCVHSHRCAIDNGKLRATFVTKMSPPASPQAVLMILLSVASKLKDSSKSAPFAMTEDFVRLW